MNLNRSSHLAAVALSAVLAAPAQQYAPPNQPAYQAAGPSDNTAEQYADPPSRVARLSVVQGNVSLEPAGVDTFSQAELNYPLTAGDRVYADNSSMSELQTDGLAVRLGNGADLTLSSLTDQVAQFGLAQGSIRLRTRELQAADGSPATVEVDTPNGTILVQRAGDIRVDSYPQDDTTVVTVTSGQVEVTGPNLDATVNAGQSLRLAGTNPVYTQALRLLPPDQLDNFDLGRERERQQGLAASAQYVDTCMVGVADLGQYGDWAPNQDYGSVWFPRAVSAGWTPYSNGHWAWVAPWGWTWIEAEPWGFAPFHYGRWAAFDGRWGWVPGPPPQIFAGQRALRPVYSPALVAFVGGPRFSISVGFGSQSGAGVTAWFPLGPREAYQPWYHASPAYVNRVNVTNLYTRNAGDVRNTYNNRTTNLYNSQQNYVNRPGATVAVAQRDFASGRGVAQSQHLRMDNNTQRRLAQAPILPHPLVTPQAGAAAPQAPPRALPPNQSRPVVETRRGFERAGQAPDARQGYNRNQDARQQPAQPSPLPPEATQPGRENHSFTTGRQPVPQQPAPAQQPPMVHTQPAQVMNQPVPPQNPRQPRQQESQPQQAPQQGTFRGNFPQQRDHTPVAPSQAPVTQTPQPTQQQPTQQQPARGFGAGATPQRPVPAAPQQPVPAPVQTQAPQQYNLGRPVQRPPEAARPLINRTEPQPAQPSFPAQQKAIQAADPGRPLGPQQVQNVRAGRPAGPAAQPEPAVHPPAAATPRPGRVNPNAQPQNAPQ